jgi:hypothetical protein
MDFKEKMNRLKAEVKAYVATLSLEGLDAELKDNNQHIEKIEDSKKKYIAETEAKPKEFSQKEKMKKIAEFDFSIMSLLETRNKTIEEIARRAEIASKEEEAREIARKEEEAREISRKEEIAKKAVPEPINRDELLEELKEVKEAIESTTVKLLQIKKEEGDDSFRIYKKNVLVPMEKREAEITQLLEMKGGSRRKTRRSKRRSSKKSRSKQSRRSKVSRR